MNLDDELRLALGRVEPPAGFAARVTARARRRKPVYRFAVWAAAAGLLIAGGLHYQRQREGERAKEQAMTALRIAARELHSVQAKMERIHRMREER